jgi:hypothetical protein
MLITMSLFRADRPLSQALHELSHPLRQLTLCLER